jgi:hypothetical protein
MLRMTMPDGRQWSVMRQHEMTRILTRRDDGTRRLYLFFEDESGACRRAEVEPDFPEPGQAAPDAIRSAWLTADVLN